MNVTRLAGCGSSPLGAYLKALGVLKIVGEQADASARGWWDGTFVLASRLARAEISEFFLNAYVPSPVVSPWNSDGGFSRDGKRKSEKVLAGVADSTDPRLAVYRRVITECWRLVDEPGWADRTKLAKVNACRNRLPEEALSWLDATVVLTDGDPRFPPLLGTGGNLGRLEISSNYMQRLSEALGINTGTRPPARDRRAAWLDAALFGEGTPKPVAGSIGQYDPGLASYGKVNPWDYVLTIEGALMFTSGLARRAGRDSTGTAAVPFTVNASGVGYTGTAEAEQPKAELWAPLWRGPMGVREARHLFQEGRLRLGRAPARSGLDAARAAVSLGADRRIDAFARYVFVERFGQGVFAIDAGRLTAKPRAEVGLFGRLDGWLNRIRRLHSTHPLPGHVLARLRAVEQAEYAVAHGGDRRPTAVADGGLLEVLVAAAELDEAVGRSGTLRAQVGPLVGLPAGEWLLQVATDSVEFRLAAGFASLRSASGWNLRMLVRPITRGTVGLGWSRRPALVDGFGHRSLIDVLADAHAIRVIQREQEDTRLPSRENSGDPGGTDTPGQLPLPFEYGTRVAAPDMAALLSGRVHLARLQRILTGLLLLNRWDTPGPMPQRNDNPGSQAKDNPPDPAWRMLAPFYVGRPLTVGGRAVLLAPHPSWPWLLYAGRVHDVLDDAARRLRAERLAPLVDPRRVTVGAASASGATLSAALMLCVTTGTASRALDSTATHQLPMLGGTR